MSDYISREDAIKRIAEVQDKATSGTEDVTYYRAIKIIRDIPVTDVQPAKRGRWINVDTLKESKHWKCSCCKGMIETAHCCYDCYYNYCPNCGADMKEGES